MCLSLTQDYFHRSPQKVQIVLALGWLRKTILKGLKELETGIICADDYRSRGRKKLKTIFLHWNRRY